MIERPYNQGSAKIVAEQDPLRLRPSDLPCIVGDASRARTLHGWALEQPFEDALAAVLEDCRARGPGLGRMHCLLPENLS